MLQSIIHPEETDPGFVGGAQGTEETRVAAPALLQYWQVVIRWRWVIVGIMAASLAAGLIATLLMTPKFTATARLEISREQKKVTNVEGIESNEAGQDQEFYQTQYSLLQARSLAERVARALRLANSDSFFAAHGVSMEDSALFSNSRARPLTGAEQQKRERIAVRLLLKNISISPIRQSRLVDIGYTSSSPELSAKIANAWAQQFIEASMARRFESTSDARRFLETRLAGLRSKLEQSERDLVGYANQKGIVTLAEREGADGKTRTERTLTSVDLEALNAALAKATSDRIAAESRLRTGNTGGANMEALSNTAINQIRERRAEVAANYAKMLVQFEPGYPAARALQEQLRTLDASIAREEARVRGGVVGEYREALAREQDLRDRVDGLKQQLGQQQRDSIQYNIYQREADTNRELYDGLLQRYKEIGVAGVGANNIAVVDTAKVPDEPSSPNLPINLLLSLIAGLGLAALTTFVLEQIDEGIREPGQVNHDLQIPLLGAVPDVQEEDALATLQDPKSNLSEAYLTIRSNLSFSTDHGVPRSLMVTSTREAEGKSTTSVALAMMAGRTGRRTLLIDADMRSPSLHGYLGLHNPVGLSNFLAGDDNWRHLVQETDAKGLFLMPAGPKPPSPAELLSSDRMGFLVTSLLEQFDHILIDAPPLLGLADAPLLSRAVEGVVFVVEAEGVAVRGLNAALDRLRALNTHIYGAVLTKVHSREAGYGYGYGFGYGYGEEKAA